MLVCVCVWASLRVKVFNVKSAKESATLMRVEKHVIPCTLLAQQPTPPPPPPAETPRKPPFWAMARHCHCILIYCIP